MLDEKFGEGKYLFRNFDEADVAMLGSEPIRWLRIIRTRFTDFPALNFHKESHVQIQAGAKLQRLRNLRALSVELETCSNITETSYEGMSGIRFLTLRSMRTLHSVEMLRDWKDLRALWILAKPSALKDLSPVLQLPALKILWVSPFPRREMERLSQEYPKIQMCNSLRRYKAGESSEDLAPFFDAARDEGCFDLRSASSAN